MRIDIIKLLDFYDQYRDVRARHVAAINGFLGDELILAFFSHYMASAGKTVTVTSHTPVATETRQRLSRWLIVSGGSNDFLYQTLVRNWSVYSTGVPRTLRRDMDIRALRSWSRAMFGREWNTLARTFKDQTNVGKVMLPMGLPDNYQEESPQVRPLVCYWYPISNSLSSNRLQFFFTLKNRRGEFREVDIFSTSLYARSLLRSGVGHVDLDLGHVNTTLDLLRSFMVFRGLG